MSYSKSMQIASVVEHDPGYLVGFTKRLGSLIFEGTLALQ